ncbi:SDR family NAD(P)-dependent oxidoreductase [Leptospira jelokensis]|uniref:SDR family NAD(P)-dependent oxidoreductase n=1 Tax=Leptospira jelokensis TaxID=2484931 RepID=A0A4Z1A6J9_9LEPT|nr:SDR family NAD(P)-dependent oxidoreductase [Leptospira jelokensis]TGL75075.1 SDR family NAD(P)-dependent oxidoreductase [Leptospira jelokensis]
MKVFVVTGATDGIGKAFIETCLEKTEIGKLRIIAIGRSKTKMDALLARELPENVELEGHCGDFSVLANIKKLVKSLKIDPFQINLIFHSMGILNPKKSKTNEGIEINFATSFLSRFYLTKLLFENQMIGGDSVLVNIAASSEKIPNYLKVNFANHEENDVRMGMAGHGQAQLANDLWVVEVAKRYHLSTIGIGPGIVKTNIRREIPNFFEYLIAPFFIFKTKTANEVSNELWNVIQNESPKKGNHRFYKDQKFFDGDPWILSEKNRKNLWNHTENKIKSI